MFSRRASAVVIVALVLLALLASVIPAFAAGGAGGPAVVPAHARLTGSAPADGSTVATAEEVVLTFNEDVDPTFVEVRLDGPDGAAVAGAPSVDGRSVTQALGAVPVGRYTVTYRVVSADGHPISGTVSFTTTSAVSPSASPTATSAASPTATPSPVAGAAPGTRAASQDEGTGVWVWLLLGGVVLVGLLVLATQRRFLARPGTDAEDAAPDGRPVDARPDGRDDPFA